MGYETFMNFSNYQQLTQRTAVYPKDQAIPYLITGLTSEVGEVADLIKKSIRDGTDRDTYLQNMEKELGDCLYYLARLADEEGICLNAIAQHNIDKLLDRKKRGKIHGSGDHR